MFKGRILEFRTRGPGGSLSAVVAVAAMLASGAPASAQGFLDFLTGRRPAPAAPPPSATAYAPSPSLDFLRNEPRQRETVQQSDVGGGRVVGYCVRLCDGHYFPIQRHGNASPAEVCSAFCPASRTKVFSGSSINYAVARDGTRYASLANAFVYREKLMPGCTCNGKTPFGLAAISVENDPTLRAGDIVATAEGFKAYQGSNRRKQAADFTPIESVPGVSDLRKRLVGVKIRHFTPASTATSPAEPPSDASASKGKQAQLSR